MAGGGIKINNIKVSGGADGITFIPSVDASGNLSWQAKRGNNVLDNITLPETVNIKGRDGKDGKDGEKGATGSKLVSQSLNGVDANGNDVYLQTFDDGTTATFVAKKGRDGKDGKDGERGQQGEKGNNGVGVRSVSVEKLSKIDKENKYKIQYVLTNGEKFDAGEISIQDGDTGAILVKQELIGEDENGNTKYKQTFDNGTTAEFVAKRGLQGIQGEKGVGIRSVSLEDISNDNEKIYRLKITTTDGEMLDAGSIVINDGLSSIIDKPKSIQIEKPLQITTVEKEEITSLEFNISTPDVDIYIGDVSQYTIGNKYLCIYVEGLTNYYSTTDGTQRYTSNVVLIGFGQTLKAYSEPYGDYVYEFNIVINGSPDNCIVKQYGYAPAFSTIKIVDKGFSADTYIVPTGKNTFFLPNESGTLATQEWVEKKSTVVLYMQGASSYGSYDYYFKLPTEGARKITVVYTSQYNYNIYENEFLNENIVVWDNGQPISGLYFNLLTDNPTNDEDYYAQVPLVWIRNNTTMDFQFYQADGQAYYNGTSMNILVKIEY